MKLWLAPSTCSNKGRRFKVLPAAALRYSAMLHAHLTSPLEAARIVSNPAALLRKQAVAKKDAWIVLVSHKARSLDHFHVMLHLC